MIRIALLFAVYVSLLHMHARHTLDSVQEIHKNVGNSLLQIRKHYPESQQQVYTTIDQVSKLCDISKKQHSKRKTLKQSLAEERKKNEEIMGKVERVAQKVIELQGQLADKERKIAILLHGEQAQQVAVTPAAVAPPQVSFAGAIDIPAETLEKLQKQVQEEKKAEGPSENKKENEDKQ